MAPRRNRVRPDGSIVASAARGTYFGNRGCLHGPAGGLRRHFRGRAWIACLLEFKGRRRELLVPGRYTELFFLDEATALAAGHRPCAECRRADFVRFADAWQRSHAGSTRPRADEIDAELHPQRTIDLDAPARWSSPIDALPDGSMVEIDDECEFGLILSGEVLRWGSSGYGAPVRTGPNVTVVTPRATVATIRAGYTVDLHPSARQPEGGIAPSA